MGCFFINLILNLNLFKNVERTTAACLSLSSVLLPVPPLTPLPSPVGCAELPLHKLAALAAAGEIEEVGLRACQREGLGVPTVWEGAG